jgi:hypothetical protein
VLYHGLQVARGGEGRERYEEDAEEEAIDAQGENDAGRERRRVEMMMTATILV